MRRRMTALALCGAVVLVGCTPGEGAVQADRESAVDKVLAATSDVEIAGPSGEPELPPEANPGPLHYVALGDSYSSGEGAPYVSPEEFAQFEAENKLLRRELNDADFAWSAEQEYGWLGNTGTHAGGHGNGCHRSDHAYPVRVWGALDRQDPNWGISFRACSGALSAALRSGSKGEPPQLDAFDEEKGGGGPADLITVGLGGNDVGFADIIIDCVQESLANRFGLGRLRLGSHGDCQRIWEPRVEERLANLRVKLRVAYAQLQEDERLKDGGKVMAVGFPRAFPPEPSGTCSLGTGSSIGEDTMRWLNEGVADKINAVIAEEADRARISYINTTHYFSELGPFGRHDLCLNDGGERWINRIIPSDKNRSIHPKFQYHEKVALAVLRYWRTCPPAGTDQGSCNLTPPGPYDESWPIAEGLLPMDEPFIGAPYEQWANDNLGCSSDQGGPGIGIRLDNAAFGDVTRDGVEDAIITLKCEGPTTSWPEKTLVLDGANGKRDAPIVHVWENEGVFLDVLSIEIPGDGTVTFDVRENHSITPSAVWDRSGTTTWTWANGEEPFEHLTGDMRWTLAGTEDACPVAIDTLEPLDVIAEYSIYTVTGGSVFLCAGFSGQVYYVGKAVSGSVVLPAGVIGDSTFQATNDGYTYTVSAAGNSPELIVTQGETILARDRLRPV